MPKERHSNPYHAENPARERKAQRAALFLMSTGLAASVFAGLYSLDKEADMQAQQHDIQVEQDALSDIEHALNATVTVKGGAAYRTTPQMINSSNPEVGRDNIAERLDNDKELEINYPMIYTDVQGDRWLGFTLASEQGGEEDVQESLDTVYWVNDTELSAQGLTSYDYKGDNPLLEAIVGQESGNGPAFTVMTNQEEGGQGGEARIIEARKAGGDA